MRSQTHMSVYANVLHDNESSIASLKQSMLNTTQNSSDRLIRNEQNAHQAQALSAQLASDQPGYEHDKSDEPQLCKRCSSIPTAACPRRDLYCGRIDLAELAKSTCKVCRLIARVMSIYRPGPEIYKLIWEPCSGEQNDIIGNVSLVPLYVKHDASAVSIPVGSIVDVASTGLETVLRRIYPEKIDVERIAAWLGDCDMSRHLDHPTHIQCARESHESLQNFRLIDCRTRRIVAAPEHCKYVALSYVWGPSTSLVYIEGSPLPNILPQTIEDSIAMVLMLDYMYLWVDRYVSSMFFVRGATLTLPSA